MKKKLSFVVFIFLELMLLVLLTPTTSQAGQTCDKWVTAGCTEPCDSNGKKACTYTCTHCKNTDTNDQCASSWGGQENCGTGGNSCTATYTLTPSSPLDANTNFSVKMSNVSTPYNRCTMIFNDGQPSNNCRLTDNDASTTCDFNSGSAGSHTIQAKFGQGQYYSKVDCGSTSYNCNSTTYTTNTAQSPTSGTPPATPTITPAACITGNYNGSGITISWANSNPAVTYVDISTVSNFASWYNKPVSGTSTNASGFTGMPGTSVAGQSLVFQPNTTYYVRVWNGALISGVAQFNITTTCVVSCSVSGDIDGNGRIELADFDKWKNAFVNGNSIINVSPALNNCEGVSVDLVLFNTWRSQFAKQ